MATEVSFGAWVTRRRKSLDLTREQLARCAGCSVSALRKIEADERRPSINMAELLAGCLQVALAERPAFMRAARGVSLVEHLGAAGLPVEAGSMGAAPPAAAAEARPAPQAGRLPVWSTPLLGREAELAVLGQLLNDPACRLLTLTGPGGIGKTRLATAAAAAQASHFADGAFFIALAGTNSPDLLVSTVAQAVGFSFSGPADPLVQLTRHLCSREVLLVLDNFEHLLAGVEFLSRVLECAEHTRLLVTSRTVLDLQGEWVFEVQGLPLPPPEQAAGLDHYSSVDLFLQGARRASLISAPGAGDLSAIARICRLTEGLPLGIELAAAWVRVLSCTEIAEEIERSLDFLSTAARNVPERHRSLRAVFDHSWQLLGDDERQIVRRLSVFPGSFRREAAEAAAGASLPTLAALTTGSFLRRNDTGRYDLHTLVRQYAGERLAEHPEEAGAVRVAFGRYYLDFLCERERLLQGAAQERALAEIGQEIDNLRLAWAWTAERQDLALLRRAAWTFWYYYALLNLFAEGETVLRGAMAALEAPAGTGTTSGSPRGTLLAYLQAMCALLLLGQLRVEEAQALLNESLPRLRSGSDGEALSLALSIQGQLDWFTGAFAAGLECYREAYDLAQKLHLDFYMANIPIFAGRIEFELGHYDESYRWLSQGLAASRRLGNPRTIAGNLLLLTPTAAALGRRTEMETGLREALLLAQQAGDHFMVGLAKEQLAGLAEAAGHAAEANDLYEESIAIYQALDDGSSLTRALIAAGHCAVTRNEETRACGFFTEALRIAFDAHLYPTALDALLGIAALRARYAIDPDTLAIISHVRQHPAATHAARVRAEHLWSAALPRLAPEQVAAAEAAGCAECCDTIVAQALS